MLLPEIESPITCPACGGLLRWWPEQVYACALEHAYTPEELDEAQQQQLRHTLRTVVRQVQEQQALGQRRAQQGDNQPLAVNPALAWAQQLLASVSVSAPPVGLDA